MTVRSTISVAMATYNGGLYLQNQLDSLAAQECSPLEVVITDDCSKDDTVSLIKSFVLHAPFPVRLEQNSERLGYGRNFLKAASMCKGTHVAFCDQDDVWLPQKLRQVSAVLANNGYDLVVNSARVVDRSLNWLGVNFPDIDSSRPMGFDEKRVGCFWPGFTLTVSKSLLQALESEMGQTPLSYDEKLAHDELICELAYVQRSIYMISEPLAIYRQHGNNLIGFHGAINARTDMPRSCP
jgi:glycosyltransferase involved in cell wall biosynthesis